MDIPQQLRDRWLKAVQVAKEHHDAGGNPVDELEALLNEVAHDADVWQSIIDEPYG